MLMAAVCVASMLCAFAEDKGPDAYGCANLLAWGGFGLTFAV